MANSTDQLIRFLLPRTHTRGAIIKATHIQAEACRIHGLPDADAGSPGQLLGQNLSASILLHNDLGLLLEAMPGCDDARWFETLECLAKITSHDLEKEPVDILTAFESMQPKVVGKDAYTYHCACNPEDMAKTLTAMPAESLQGLEDETGRITLSCRYCGNTHHIKVG
ncbi:MAG: Hsp33 family molecular chaperone HslO [Mariprofundaceae bacterium]|nr:Hsp33 family molecular chaperone HslO [Mariprofundaceae bacterium]